MEWTKKVAFHFIEAGLFNAHILYAKEGSRKPLSRFKLECFNVLLAAPATDPSAPTASDCFSGRHYPDLIPQYMASGNHRRDVLYAPATKKEKKANTNMGNVRTSQDFGQHLASKFTTLNETEH